MLEFFATNTPDLQHCTQNSCFGAFLSVLVDLDPFRYCMKLRAKRAKLLQLMQKFVPRHLVRNFCNECSRSTPLDPKLLFGAFLSVWGHLEPFCYCMKLATKRAKLVQVMQKFMPRCLVRIFRIERSRSTPLDPKLMFLCICFRSHAFWTILLLHETCCKTPPLWCN